MTARVESDRNVFVYVVVLDTYRDILENVLCDGRVVQRLWEEASKLKDELEDMEKKLLEGKMEIEQTNDDYMKLKVM